jgi:hypothetical protein
VVIEDPTQIRISQVSLTVLSKSAFEDALKYSIDFSGHIASHGGFNESSGLCHPNISFLTCLFESPIIYKLKQIDSNTLCSFCSNCEEMGVALRGMGREPINSWLPLFIHPEHWKLVCPQLKAIIGYFVTLDPLGYNENQIDALFLVTNQCLLFLLSFSLSTQHITSIDSLIVTMKVY